MMTSKPKATWNLKRLAGFAVPVATALGAAVGMVWAASAEREAVRQQVQHHAQTLDDHEARLRVIENHCGQIRTDIEWMKGWMTRRQDERDRR